MTTAKNGLAAKSGSNLAEGREFDRGVPVHRQSPVEDGYFAHAIPGQIDSPRMRPAIASEMHSELRRAIRCSF